MLIKDIQHCEEMIAGDNTILREVLHPEKMNIPLRYSLAHAIVKPGMTSFPHKLKSSEVYYILAGEGIVQAGPESAEVYPGQVILIPPDTVQSIHNPGTADLVFLCVVDPYWKKEDEEIV